MKLKRLFTAILSAALTLSLCAMPAMATEGGTTAGTPLADGMPVWDTTKKGSITIHKFEYNPSSGAPSQQGTGAEGEGAPAGAIPLDGVTFEIYQVQSQTWLESYYGGQVTASSQDFSKMDASDYYTKNSTTGAITVNSGATKVATVTTTTTETDKGVAKKDGLALGLYLVVETKAPDKVTSPADPFLVSVPMTRIADNDTTNKLTDWIYDVHVYPKNSTTYGQVTIEKKGYTGGGTGVALEGVQFKLQKQNGADWTDITANDSNGSTYNLTTDINGKITIAGLSQGEYRIFEDAYSNTSANKGYILDAEYHTFTVQKDGKIQVDGNVSANATIQVANHRPDMKKEVYNGTEWKQDAQYGVGDTVPYKITIEVPKNIDKLSTFTVTDTPTGLTDNVSSIEVKDDTTDLTKNTHYTVADNGNGFTITFTPAEMAAYAGEKLVITYTATVSNDAVVGGKGNSNNAKLTYTNKINTHDSPAAPSTNSIEDSAVMYSFGIKVVKTAENGTTALPGVVFDLYREAKTGETPIVNAETLKKAGLDITKKWILVKSGLTTNANGIIDTSDSNNATNYTHGLANGDYYLVETKTVDGYNLLTKPVKVKLDVTATTTWQKTNVYDASGNLVKHGTVTKTTFTHTSNNGDATKTELAVAKVVNRKGFTLPVTGGFGTLLFSGIGVLLVLAGVGVLFSLKKKSNRA
ncbi:MAG: SpaH/EbpB family LPXTG-anchored major pilin [Gemmiger formicilis]|uniref:SpaH/EbpB family LPXTG-anchored major pilin n=1 Tax=Gemmiger formicilis TaxID=745368 RepID=UPI0039945189